VVAATARANTEEERRMTFRVGLDRNIL